MEVKATIQREYNPSHPNFERWQKARDLSEERAKFVKSIIEKVTELSGKMILDLGSGEGSTSQLLSKNNFVVSLEVKLERVKKISNSKSLKPLLADAFQLPFKKKSFDVIIMQDVVEHIAFTDNLAEELFSLLKSGGIIYLSTPNRLSLINIIADPHWGMPLLSLFNREQINKYFMKYFRKSDYNRTDIAELLSLNDIFKIFNREFSINLFTNYSVQYLFDGGEGLVWSNFHLRIVEIIKSFGLKKILLKMANDEHGIMNKFFTPTFYIVFKKL
ncbi:MAG: class I SAM-dependent methyltransferase [bacterium]|nr:class I SAM-dependent methyltransferase [bacterium]